MNSQSTLNSCHNHLMSYFEMTIRIEREMDPPAYINTLKKLRNNQYRLKYLRKFLINSKELEQKEQLYHVASFLLERKQQFSKMGIKILMVCYLESRYVLCNSYHRQLKKNNTDLLRELILPDILVKRSKEESDNVSISSKSKICTNVNFDAILAAKFVGIVEYVELTKDYLLDPFLKQDLSDLDEKEIEELMQTEVEAELKYTVWKELNRDYLMYIFSKKSIEFGDLDYLK